MSIMIIDPYRFASVGGGSGVYWNPLDKNANITLSGSNATATSAASGWKAVRSVTSHNSGKWYAEIVNDVNGGSSGSMIFGVGPASATLNSYVGSEAVSYGIQANNTSGAPTYNGGSATNTGGGAALAGQRAMLAVDFAAGKIWLGVNGTWETGDPVVTGPATPTYTFTPGTTLFLMLSVDSTPQQCTLKNNVGENLEPIPTGFSMWA